ncbi:hypothetical protein CMI47_01240 [Candidatus Pacearchaeota archaeon]|nr:hypothetical protein [Candidatus Pacearchaeota archaeon]|tara:strand:- start:7415 stop:9079 length:1665 start_codon:yes stop_codon:yes gene_type:complete
MKGDTLALAAVGTLALVGAASKRGSLSRFPGLTKLRDYLGGIHGLLYGGEEISYDLFPDPEDPDTLAGLVELIRNADYELTGKISKHLGAYESDARGVLEGRNEVVHLADGGWSRLTLSLHHPQLMWIDRGASTDRVVKAWDAFQEGLKRGSVARRARVLGNYRLHHIANLRGTYSSETWEGRRANEEGHKLWEDPMHGRVDTYDKWVLVEFPLSFIDYDDYAIEGQYAVAQDLLYQGIDLDPGLAFFDEYDAQGRVYGSTLIELYWGGERAGAADYRDEETFQVFMPEEHWLRYRNMNSIRSLKGSPARKWISTGSVVAGDVIRFSEAVFAGSHRNPRYVGDREVIATVLRESYGEKTGQHTFTLEVLESTGEQALQEGKRTRRKGRNIYKNAVRRIRWEPTTADPDRSEALRETVAEQKHQRGGAVRKRRAKERGSKAKAVCGDCFEANGRYFMDHAVLRGNDSSLRLVHGEVAGQGKLWGTRFGHAWVEDGDDVVDVSMGRDVRMPRILYYALGHIDQIDNLHKYDVPTFRERITEHEHWGPWDLQTSSGL